MSVTRRLVVTGTRLGRPDVWAKLDEYLDAFGEPELVILGDGKGVDAQAAGFFQGLSIPTRVFAADWMSGPNAGPKRNQEMVNAARPGDHLLAFPDESSRGTWDCYRRGQKAGLLCIDVGWPFANVSWVERLSELELEAVRRAGGR